MSCFLRSTNLQIIGLCGWKNEVRLQESLLISRMSSRNSFNFLPDWDTSCRSALNIQFEGEYTDFSPVFVLFILGTLIAIPQQKLRVTGWKIRVDRNLRSILLRFFSELSWMGCSSRKPDAVVVDHEGLLGCGFNHCICSPRKPGQDEPIFEGQIVQWGWR